MKESLLYRIIRPIIKLFIFIAFRPKVIGKENILKAGSIVIAGNHTSNLDCLLLAASVKRPIHFLAKDSLYKGIKKPFFKALNIIPVNRSIKDKTVLVNAKKVLDDGGVIGVFPEGTINRTKDIIMPFKIGAVKMCSDSTSYLIPFSITGKYKIFNNHLKIIFGKPYKVKNKDLDKENKILMDKVIELIGRGNNE